MKVSFEPHPNESVDDVQKILIDGVHVGYCGTESGRPVCFITAVSCDVSELVKKAVAENVGEASSVNQPPESVEIEGVDDDDSNEE